MSQATKAKFLESGPFFQDLRARVEVHLGASGRSPRDLPRMYAKTVVILGWFAASYVWLLLGASGPWGAVAGCVSLGLAVAGVGFSVQHDANHGSYSVHRGINRILGWTLDVIGGSSYVWSWKHNIFHHSHTNVVGLDEDIDIQPLCRLAPGQRLHRAHRFQHAYIWGLYALLPMKWHFIDDFKDLVTGRVGRQKMPRPGGLKLAGAMGGKLMFYGWAIALPLCFRPLWQVALCYALASFVLGLTLATVFQLAHCVEEADFSLPPEANRPFSRDWAAHQVASTVDFARGNSLVSWYLGGLNFQVEHHLFPRVCHLHYPALSRIVEDTCRERGIRYRANESVGAALKSHVRWLKRMGQPAIEGAT
ncbi:fatty acid desaturase family protein [Myxococcus virescens]|uniref:Fatty acid desaturase n=2 Tax=Myxococcus virescens TaxID=83456 RepID=A0A511H6J4_9BACT|nr:acyl-CoA desaturase [Myxococcus virescens]GEL69148.1 fatty acid desaturase [Myxococcus virescens]